MKKPVLVILAGGIGKRFFPFAVTKTLFPFLGKPVLQHIIEMGAAGGFTELLIATNEDTEEWLKTCHHPGLTIRTKRQDQPLGMADALLHLEAEIGKEPILVMNATDFADPAIFTAIVEKAQSTYGIVVGKKVIEYFPGGYLEISGDRVTSIIEKPAKGSEPSDMINLVFHYFSQPQDFFQALRSVPAGGDDHYERALTHLMREKHISYLPYEGYWAKLNYCHTVLDITELLLKKQIKKYTSPTAQISKLAVVEGDVYIDENAKIDDFAVVKGPAYIGKNVVVGNHALVRQSIIEEKTIVGFGSEVARSYVGPRCMLHHNFVGDSILESDINPSWGTTFANLRIDGKTVRVKLPHTTLDTHRTKLGGIVAKRAFLGVNCSVMPGVTIGEDARILPNSVVKQPVP